jgi:N-acetylmuramoyl-L-alanine amidase
LAKEIHAAYGEKFPPGGEYNLPDDGVIQSNLALVRAPQMPSVLIESAYMIVPEEEAYLKTDAFREACAEAIVTGLEHYAGRMRN